MSRKPLIAGNWKMNLNHAEAVTLVQKLAWTLDDANFNFSATEVAVFPPFTDIRSVQTLVEGDKLDILYGGQDLSVHDSGAYTGEISGAFLSQPSCSSATPSAAPTTTKATSCARQRSRQHTSTA